MMTSFLIQSKKTIKTQKRQSKIYLPSEFRKISKATTKASTQGQPAIPPRRRHFHRRHFHSRHHLTREQIKAIRKKKFLRCFPKVLHPQKCFAWEMRRLKYREKSKMKNWELTTRQIKTKTKKIKALHLPMMDINLSSMRKLRHNVRAIVRHVGYRLRKRRKVKIKWKQSWLKEWVRAASTFCMDSGCKANSTF